MVDRHQAEALRRMLGGSPALLTAGQIVGFLAVVWAIAASAIAFASDSWGLIDGAVKVDLPEVPVLTGLLGLRWLTSS